MLQGVSTVYDPGLAAGKPEAKKSARRFRRIMSHPSSRFVLSLLVTMLVATMLVALIELLVRGSFAETIRFFNETYRPGWTTVTVFALVFLLIDGILGRAHNSLLLIAPLALGLAVICHQKAYYLGDPLYPTDILYSRQILELLPMLAKERVGTAALLAVGVLLLLLLLPYAWIKTRRRMPVLTMRARMIRLVIALPALAFFASIMDYSSFSWARDRLKISPMMWDQKANYAHNGFALAFALNVPMANVAAPAFYSEQTVLNAGNNLPAADVPATRPDIIMLMSESLWDPTRLPNIKLEPDPLSYIRSVQSGHMFSPEFGGMTSNIEFEALTGFSNAFLPYGSIPYQQYVRGELPSLARFLDSEGYETVAMHPFAGWFWNRKNVYESMGFKQFLSQETLPELEKRGGLASDEAFTDSIIKRAEETDNPLFLFAVTLQGHGPYQPGRYKDERIAIKSSLDKSSSEPIRMFAEGVKDADDSFRHLVEWAEKRERPTIIVVFGDHLPPLGQPYVDTGFMSSHVASRNAPPDEMALQHETPLVIWSNQAGVKDVKSVSPALLPLHILTHAGIKHPFYTGFLGEVQEQFSVVDRNLLLSPDGKASRNWLRDNQVPDIIGAYRHIQYDMMFGKKFGQDRFFPSPYEDMELSSNHMLPSALQ